MTVKNFHLISIVGTAPTTIIKLPFREPTFSKAIEFVGVLQAICYRNLNMVWSYAVVRIYLPAFVFFVPLTIISDFSNTACGCPFCNISVISCIDPNILHSTGQLLTICLSLTTLLIYSRFVHQFFEQLSS